MFPLSIRVALLAIFAATGVVFRYISIPTFSPYVTLTPGFIMPLLSGLVLGPIGGIICGTIVGISGAIFSTEPFLIPLIGNIALGLSTGIPVLFRARITRNLWIGLTILTASIVGGFLPTFSIEAIVHLVPLSFAALTASIDAIQATIWVSVALFIDEVVIHPLLNRYQRVGLTRSE
jgi:hypothetical protein